MKKFSIKCTGSNVEEAMNQIGELSGLDPKQKNCLTLLTEEMFSMMSTVLANKEATFAIAKEDETWTLTMIINTYVDLTAKRELLSMATDGKNLAHKGLKGAMTAFLELISGGDAAAVITPNAMVGDTVDYVQMWQMSQYLTGLSDADRAKAWDGLEKSIIANFADDVFVGVTDNRVKMVVTKKF